MQANNATVGRSYLLALGFGTTVAMWTAGYIFRIPPVWLPSPVLGVLLLALLFAGGFAAGRWSGGGVRAGVEVGLVVSLLNLLVLGSLLSGDGPGGVLPSAVVWIPGSLAAGAVIGALGAVLGKARAAGRAPIDWTAAFARVGVAATFTLVVIGGLVTSRAAGLDVPDWPSSFGYNMFLYPLSRMSGGIYFEHSHRLFGSLVGLTTLVLTLHLLKVDRRGWVRFTAIFAFGLVVAQGVLGGYRVTTAEIQSTPDQVLATAETAGSEVLRVVHGVTGQLFLACMCALAAFTSRTWKSGHAATVTRLAPTDHALAVVLLVTVFVQLVLGALFRHVSMMLFVHIAMAVVVLVVAVLTGARAAGLDQGQPLLKRLGQWVLWLVTAQVMLGLAALVVRGVGAGVNPPPAYKVIVTTMHQANGAALLGAGALLVAWSRRLLRPGSAA